MIYHDAVQKRTSSSSEDMINTSVEFSPPVGLPGVCDRNPVDDLQQKFNFAFDGVTGRSGDRRSQDGRREYEDGKIHDRERELMDRGQTPQQLARNQAEALIKEAEVSKACVMEVPGNTQISLDFQFIHSVLVDTDYQLVAVHVDAVTRKKIENCEYVDFSRLLPKNKPGEDDELRMQMVNHNGRAYYVPMSKVDKVQVNSLFCWEQAFRVFSDIFTRKFPNKSTELIQYNHMIHTAANVSTWDCVTAYDRDFRRHMACHPLCSWGIILQQAWTMHIKEGSGKAYRVEGGQPRTWERSTGGRKKDLCWRFNQDKCSYGLNCKFDHHCGVCGKFGHGAHTCRKLGMERGNDRGD